MAGHRSRWRRYFPMALWRTVKARKLLRALKRKGWQVARQRGSHRILTKTGWSNITFAFHDQEEIGPKMLSKIAKYTDLKPEDL